MIHKFKFFVPSVACAGLLVAGNFSPHSLSRPLTDYPSIAGQFDVDSGGLLIVDKKWLFPTEGVAMTPDEQGTANEVLARYGQ